MSSFNDSERAEDPEEDDEAEAREVSTAAAQSAAAHRLAAVQELSAAYASELQQVLAELARCVSGRSAATDSGEKNGTEALMTDGPKGESEAVPAASGKQEANSLCDAGELAPRPREPRWQAVEALERQAAGMLARGLDRDAAGALGLLVGRRGRWVLHRSALVLGRREPGLDAVPKRGPDPPLPERLPLDINLALELGEPNARRVSRRQALLWVAATDLTACFRVARLGRGALAVDGVPVAQGASVALKHGGLLQVGGAFLLVLVNEAALRRLVGRTRASCA
ncbi:hypothetical protein QBZ16_000902 [Prototheca wickerhamii]|uniref:FHA domain-containing protein n=1 Tax=Prototheca wickerhamii TaxID=3111 RepID=A0AAD9IHS3_PROWI|nr:hypothetical protein QBZ16_000902 [Prototheca wickerhamii]